MNFCLFHLNLSWASGKKKKKQCYPKAAISWFTWSTSSYSFTNLGDFWVISLPILLLSLKPAAVLLFCKDVTRGAPPVLVMSSTLASGRSGLKLSELSWTGGNPWSLPTEVTPALLLLVKPWHENPIVRKNAGFQKHVFKILCSLCKEFCKGPVLSPDKT